MTFGLSEEQQDLAGAVASVLERSSGREESPWPELAAQVGIAGLTIPECYGGAGASLPEVAVVARELGRELTPSPLLGSAVLAAHAVLTSGDTGACERLLPPVAEGRSVCALAWTGTDGKWDVEDPACRAEGTAVSGTAHYVLDGDSADVLLVAAHTGSGVGVYEVDPHAEGVLREARPTMDESRALATIGFDRVEATPLAGADGSAALARAREAAWVVLAAECAGAAERALQRTVEYTKQRTQFGRPIGGFQALKHRMADCHVLVESARAIAFEAAVSGEDTAAAKVYCSEALHHVAAEMIQLHGGIAITWEHEAHRYLKRAEAALHLFGGSPRLLSAVDLP